MKNYIQKNVLESSMERIRFIFDHFENIVVSVSGGKDSTAVAHLVLREAILRKRKVGIFFLDEEVVYQGTVDQVSYLMELYPEVTERLWLQIPFNLTNSADSGDGQLHCWDPSAKDLWMHPMEERNITKIPWIHKTKVANRKKGFGFYDAFRNFELTYSNCAHIIGLRADESLDRYRVMVKNPGYGDVLWSTKKDGVRNVAFYPIYDWQISDVWKYIFDSGLKYHHYYDFAFKKGVSPSKMRVSSLIHEKSYKSISDLIEFEPYTYDKLLARCAGISFVQETANDKKSFKCQRLPKNFTSWRSYRDFMLSTYENKAMLEVFMKRFSTQEDSEFVARQQCRQLYMNDYENNVSITKKKETNLKSWMELL